MKHPEYDSPFELVMSDITAQMAKSVDETCWQAVQRVGINVDKEKLLIALKQDAERYREAYANGYDTGYEKRDDEIIRCKDCKYWDSEVHECAIKTGWFTCSADWYCADGKLDDDESDRED